MSWFAPRRLNCQPFCSKSLIRSLVFIGYPPFTLYYTHKIHICQWENEKIYTFYAHKKTSMQNRLTILHPLTPQRIRAIRLLSKRAASIGGASQQANADPVRQLTQVGRGLKHRRDRRKAAFPLFIFPRHRRRGRKTSSKKPPWGGSACRQSESSCMPV